MFVANKFESVSILEQLQTFSFRFQFIEENEEFRERLGLDSRNLDDIVELRKNRVLRQQQFRAENQVLLKEIEALEEERISLKKQVIVLVQIFLTSKPDNTYV